MYHWLAVMRRNLDGRVCPTGGGPADKQRQFEVLTLHLAGDVYHLVERRSNQTAESDHVRLFRRGAFEDLFAGDHHPHVDHLIVITGKHDADDVLANIVNVALDRCEDDFSLRLDLLARCSHRNFLGLHERRQVRHSLFHHTGRLDHLGQEHLARAEQIADHAHAGHQRAFDH